MHRQFYLAIAAVMLAVAGCGHSSARHLPAPDPSVVSKSPAVATVANANTDFTFRLLKRLTSETPSKNVFISPYGITNALSVLMNGAAGKTQAQIETTLGLGSTSIATVNSGNQLLLPSLSDPDPKVKLSIANAIWANKGTFPAAFKQTVSTSYDASAEDLDLTGPSAANTINKWVSDNTEGKIDQIVSSDDLQYATTVITDAVYFHGHWSKEFDKSSTQSAPFHLEDGKDKTVPLMSNESGIRYCQTAQFQACELTYGDGRIGYYIVLPKPGVKLAEVLKAMDGKSWGKTMTSMKPDDVMVYLPRFHANYAASLNDPLRNMGMPLAFDDKRADLSPMGDRGSYISAVFHKAVIDVDEEGTTAAAATGIVASETAMRLPGTIVRVDHPFFCAIRDNLTGTILFAGAIYDPQSLN